MGKAFAGAFCETIWINVRRLTCHAPKISAEFFKSQRIVFKICRDEYRKLIMPLSISSIPRYRYITLSQSSAAPCAHLGLLGIDRRHLFPS